MRSTHFAAGALTPVPAALFSTENRRMVLTAQIESGSFRPQELACSSIQYFEEIAYT